jgi:hypothetical protein
MLRIYGTLSRFIVKNDLRSKYSAPVCGILNHMAKSILGLGTRHARIAGDMYFTAGQRTPASVYSHIHTAYPYP